MDSPKAEQLFNLQIKSVVLNVYPRLQMEHWFSLKHALQLDTLQVWINDGAGKQLGDCNVAIKEAGHKLHVRIFVLQSKQFWKPHAHVPFRTTYGLAHVLQICGLSDWHYTQF